MKKEHNQPYLKPYRKFLRNHGTVAEAALWMALKGRKFKNRKFRRQHSVGPYILDFYCPSEKLAIELDGSWHDDILRMDYDHERTRFLNARGIRVVRIENKLLFEAPDDVLDYVADHFRQSI